MSSARGAALCAGVAAFAFAAAGAWGQTLGQAADDGISLWRVAGALLFCLALAVAVPVFLKGRWSGVFPGVLGMRTDSRLKLVESLRLSPQVNLCLVCCDGHELLLAVSPQGAVVVREISAPTP